MKTNTLLIGVVLAVMNTGVFAQTGGNILFSDRFQSAQLSSEWKIESGNWTVKDGCLSTMNTGSILLNIPLGGQFEIEEEISYQGRTSLFFSRDMTPPLHAQYLQIQSIQEPEGKGRWELTEYDQGVLIGDIYGEDADIAPKVFHKIKVIYDYGLVTVFSDGKLKGSMSFHFNPEIRLSFTNQEMPDGHLRIKKICVRKTAAKSKMVSRLRTDDFVKSAIYTGGQFDVKLATGERLGGGGDDGAELKYSFGSGDTFECRFARTPIEVTRCKHILAEVEGDGSKNKFFIIVHDRSGEKHLVADIPLTWVGRKEIGINLATFLESNKQRSATHWGGDENQKIDFPIQAIDIGVAKRGVRVKDSGQMRIHNVRFLE